MKKTIITLLALAGVATAADSGSTSFTGGTTYKAGATYGNLELKESMTTGTYSSLGITIAPNVNIKSNWGWFSAGDYTVSIWVDSDSLESNQILFGYCGSWSGNAKGYNGLTWNAQSNTLTLGKGEWKADAKTFTYTDSSVSSDLSSYITDGLTNITLAVDSATNGKMTADLWINGTKIETLATYAGDMQNSADQMKYFVGKNGATYGTIFLTNEQLTSASDIAALAGANLVPEPTTATLSLLALAGLAARRRRK